VSAEIVTIGACVVCGKRGRIRLTGCAPCLERFGERWFELAEKCQRQPAFARAVFAKIKDRQGQARFVELFGADVLGMDPEKAGAIDLGRKLKNEGTWERRGEWTVPPPAPVLVEAEGDVAAQRARSLE
jgi:hypothetical protein